jgi:hypothetical protein
MQPFQQRVVDEQKELDVKLGRLHVFMAGDLMKSLPLDEQKRLNEQYAVMQQYSRILGERIAHFQEVPPVEVA